MATVEVAGAVDPGFVADGAAELLQGLQVALARQEQAGPAVVPDGSGLLPAITGLDLGQVVEGEKELDAVASGIRGSSQRPRQVRAVEAIEPASTSGVRAKPTSKSAALSSSVTAASCAYSPVAVRLSRASSVAMSPPRSCSTTARAV